MGLTAASPAVAQSGAQCAGIAADGERLACYDAVFRGGSVDVAAQSVTFQSAQLIPARPSGRAPATVTVVCRAGVLSVEFAFAGNTLSTLGRDAGITLQADLQAARSRTLPVNDDNTALVIGDTADSIAFLDMLVGADNLTIRATPVNLRSLSVRFSLEGVLERVAPVREACT
ncbi:hypothetical protein DMC47_26805 [Nostoc sp. 3335mG]|nr:hypothetical protein DMC47_26805 [Nostoc sp. 3335mG]